VTKFIIYGSNEPFSLSKMTSFAASERITVLSKYNVDFVFNNILDLKVVYIHSTSGDNLMK